MSRRLTASDIWRHDMDEPFGVDNNDEREVELLLEQLFGEAGKPESFGSVGEGEYAIVFEQDGRRFIETSKLVMGTEASQEFYEWLDNAICWLLDEDDE